MFGPAKDWPLYQIQLPTTPLGPWLNTLVWVLAGPVVLILGTYFWLVPNVVKDSRRWKLPPGPRGLPFVGNLFDLAESDEVRYKVRRWHQKFGDIFYTKIGGTDYVWLSSPQVIKDLMDKRSAIYSSRPRLPLAQDVASAGRRQLFMEYGPRWRQLRKHSHDLLNRTAAVKYQPVQDFESKQVLRDLLDQPEAFYTINRRYSSSVIMLVSYGYRIPSLDDPLMRQIYTVLDHLTEITAPGAHAVDSFPSLAALPEVLLGRWRTHGRRVLEHDSAVYMGLWRRLVAEVAAGTARDCFCRDFYLADPAKNNVDELLAAYTCGGLVEAGSETTASTLNNWVLAMTLYPDTARRAQEELDRVVGEDRIPQWEDQEKLPYVRAMIKEVLRWRPVNKFGMLHAVSEDDWYNGYFIPKDSVAVLNWWAIHRDANLYPDPDKFDPARFLDKPLSAAEYINAPDARERDHFAYGAGRRVCPGVHVAERSLFINVARVLWGFDIGPRVDAATGRAVPPNTKTVPGFLTVPQPFECDIRPRSAARARVIRETFAAAERTGIAYRDFKVEDRS